MNNTPLSARANRIIATNLLLSLKDFTLSWLGLLCPWLPEVGIVQVFWEVESFDIKLCLCGDHISLVDTSQWASIEYIRSSYKQQSSAQLFQEHNMLKRDYTIN